MRHPEAIVLALFLATAAAAQEPQVLYPLWSTQLAPNIGETVDMTKLEVADVQNTGYADVYTVTTGSLSTKNVLQKNHITVFSSNGSTLWDYGVDAKIRASILYDINNDRKLETIVSSGQSLNNIQRGSVRMIGSDGKLMRQFDSTAIMNSMEIGDLNNDRYYDIVGGSERKIYLFGLFGEDIWTYPAKGESLLNTTITAVAMDDVDGDGRAEVIAGGSELMFLSATGGLMGSIDLEPASNKPKSYKYLIPGKFLGGGYTEILAVTGQDLIAAVAIDKVETSGNSKTVQLKLGWQTQLGCEVKDAVVTNLDADNLNEVLIACSDKKIYAIDNNGALMWVYPLDGVPNSICLKDIDEDGQDDILVAVDSGAIYALDKSGDFKWRFNTGSPAKMVAAGDIDGDQQNEIAVASEGAHITAYKVNETFNVRRRADTLYNMAQDAYISSKFPIALDLFKQAKALYEKLGNDRGIENAQGFITKIESQLLVDRQKEADDLYSKASQYYASGDYQNAQALVEKAAKIYSEFGSTEGTVKCELLRMQIEKRVEGVPDTTLPPSTSTTAAKPAGGANDMTVYIICAAVILAAAVIVMRKRSGGGDEVIAEVPGPGVDSAYTEAQKRDDGGVGQ